MKKNYELNETGFFAKNIGKGYSGRPVIRDVSINVKKGEVVALLGPNGAGKTTSFYIMVGLISPDYGNVFLDGVDVTTYPMHMRGRAGIGYLPQESSVFKTLTVEENIMAVLEVVEKTKSKRNTILENLLAEFSISHLRNVKAIALSGGERRRLEIARALATSPNYILLDEPLAGVDPVSIKDIAKLIKQLRDRGLGVLVTDHNVRETLSFVDRAYVLHSGSVLMEGSPEKVISSKEVRSVYLGDNFSI